MSTERHSLNERDERIAPGATLERALPAAPAPSVAELDALFGQIEGAAARDRGLRAWLRSRSTPARWMATVLLVVAIVAAEALFKPRPDLGVYPALRMGIALGAMGLLAFLALGVGLRPLHRPASPRWLTGLILLAGAVVPLALAVLPPAHLDHPAALVGGGPDLVRYALACFLYGGVLGLPVVGLLLVLDRGGHVGLVRAGAASLAAALAANLALQAHCPIVAPGHLVLGHASLAFVYPALYVALSRRFVRRSPMSLGPRPTP